MDLVILNHSQVTRTTHELASPLITTTPTGGRSSSQQIKRASLPYTAGLQRKHVKQNWEYQQDSSSVLTLNATKNYLSSNNIAVTWPLMIPDLNLTEVVWGIMSRKDSRGQYCSVDTLSTSVESE
ncbi:hypothetical protein TNCV_4434941 [Trichonephila clavipes]|nr:hypothetical protein TNCV_4434941 [Trichonephila clavipes]